MSRDSADRRLARLLCELERYGYPSPSGQGTRLPIQLRQADLASWIGTCPETVERALRRWRNRNIVSTGYLTLIVHDLEALARIAGVRVLRRTWDRPQQAQAEPPATRRALRYQR
jgi:Crp-like helix-turn-helix domain